MKVITNIATLCMAFGLTIFAGSILFGAGSLTVIGWLVTLPLFLGASAHVCLSVYNMIPVIKEATPTLSEKDRLKPSTQTA